MSYLSLQQSYVIGNSLTYRYGMTFSWSNGRQLGSYTKNGETVSYTYDTNGMRLTKTVDGIEHTYLYENGLLVQKPIIILIVELLHMQNTSSTQNTARVLGAFVYSF